MTRRLLSLLTATVALLSGTAWAATPPDSRITAATAAWSSRPLYVDPDYTSLVDETQTAEMLRAMSSVQVPVYVAVVPTGDWFPEEGDTALLAGRLAAANGKPGVYVVMDGSTTYGVEHEVKVYAPSSSYAEAKQSMGSQLTDYLADVKVDDRYEAKPARTEPLPPRPESTSEPDRFTTRDAIGNGLGGGVLGLMGGALLAGVVLAVAAMVARRSGGTR
ncbi:hypothetical protein [Kribbella sp. CA-247076]|uniref:hypothetical protein n=1 Tax=Kribbella sp. CA-247076 TaxID=3239941 RepID=UPI003D917302